ncbi:MAG: GTP-binding protein, partial [Actinobacteria bacterium]|nr:GTP-binding protein [Actinomycetota bacterium]
MKDYAMEKIRNVCLLSHGGAGKTTLAEAMLFNTGVLDRFGKVAEGTTTTDYDPEEIRRKISISTALAPCEWKDFKINIIDTPGYFDFVGEVKQAMRVADGALILVPAKGGVSVGAEKSWAYADEQGVPKMIFVSKMDEENADFFAVMDQLVNTFGKGIVAFQIPIVEGEKFVGFVDVINMNAKKFEKDKLVDIAIPAGLNDRIASIRDALNEAIAETDEGLMEKFFGGEEFTHEEILKGLRIGIGSGSLVPVFCGSAINNLGIQALLDAVAGYMPSPADKPVIKGKKFGTDEVVDIKAAADGPLSAIVFKTIADPFVGKISMFRVYSGTLKSCLSS